MLHITSNYENHLEAFKNFVLPVLPIISPGDINSLLIKSKNGLLLPVELACFHLIVETGSLISATKMNWHWGFITPHTCASSIAAAAKYIQEAKDPDLNLIQACLLMCFFLLQKAQSCDWYLNKAVNYLWTITKSNEAQSEETALLWLSLACMKL
jgi:hypothetical protein